MHTLHCLPSKWTEWKAVHATCICPVACAASSHAIRNKRELSLANSANSRSSSSPTVSKYAHTNRLGKRHRCWHFYLSVGRHNFGSHCIASAVTSACGILLCANRDSISFKSLNSIPWKWFSCWNFINLYWEQKSDYCTMVTYISKNSMVIGSFRWTHRIGHHKRWNTIEHTIT